MVPWDEEGAGTEWVYVCVSDFNCCSPFLLSQHQIDSLNKGDTDIYCSPDQIAHHPLSLPAFLPSLPPPQQRPLVRRPRPQVGAALLLVHSDPALLLALLPQSLHPPL